MALSIRHATLTLLGLGLLSGCLGATPATRLGLTANDSALLSPSDVVMVIPLRDGSCLPIYGDHVKCHLTGEHLDAGQVPAGTGAALGEVLHGELEARGVRLIPYARSRDLFERADPKAADAYELTLGQMLGRAAGANKALMGIIARYDKRQGSRWGSGTPAAVSFSLALIDVASGRIVHKSRFNRRQSPLSTNLLALPLWWKQGVGWWSRREVAEEALGDAADTLTGRSRSTAGRSEALPEVDTWRTEQPMRQQPIDDQF